MTTENMEDLITDVVYEDDNYDLVEPLQDIIPEKTNTLVIRDTTTGEIRDHKLTPWEIILEFAKATNTIIKDPRSGCKHCYGRGYSGIMSKTKQPIPCNCIFPVKSKVQKIQEHAMSTKFQLANLTKKQLRNYVKDNNIKLEAVDVNSLEQDTK